MNCGEDVGAAAAPSREHLVQFYAANSELTQPVAGYLDHAMRWSGTAVVLATADHHRMFAEQLAARGVDVDAARTSGALVERDADQLATDVCAGADFDPGRAERIVGELISAALARGGPVRVFGEIVALLCVQDAAGAALQLEQWWNGFAARAPFTLYCAYPASVAADPDATHWISELHGAVHARRVPVSLRGGARPADVIEFFDPDLSSPGAARDLVADVLHRWGNGSLIPDASLVVSELTTNALLHTRGGFALTLTRTPTGVRVAVHDSSRYPPVRREPGADQPTGRGTLIIDVLSRDWGVEASHAGKIVWAELAR
jgi:hypothetical protein